MPATRRRAIVGLLIALLLTAAAVAVGAFASPAHAAAGRDILVPNRIDLGKAAPGSSVPVPVRLHAPAGEPVDGFSLAFGGYRVGVEMGRYGNCTYYHREEEQEGWRGTVCRFPGVLGPDTGYEVVTAEGTPLRFDVAPDAIAWRQIGGFEVYPGLTEIPSSLQSEIAQGLLKVTEGSGAPLRVRPGGTQSPDSSWRARDTTFELVTTENPHDVQAFGDTATGKAGDTVAVTVGARNLGPASLLAGEHEGAMTIRVVIPPGTTAVTVPRFCVPATEDWYWDHQQKDVLGRPRYLCQWVWHKAGTEEKFPFELKITEVVPNARGPLALDLDDLTDENPANDRAEILINPTSPPATGGTDAVPGGQAAGGAATGGVGAGGGLPVTGPNASGLAASAGAVMVLGFLLVLGSRRRRG
jgi:LPXTG-motif cell wall-anchored protein